MNCRRQLASEHGRVIATFDCLNCGAEGHLASPTCFSKVLNAFVEDVQIDAVVLADLAHRQYAGAVIDVLRAHADVVRAAERHALRGGAAEGEKNASCASCASLPASVFAPALEAMRASPSDGSEKIAALHARFRTLPAPRAHAQCGACHAATQDGLAHLGGLCADARALVVQAAYNVTEGAR